MCRAFCAICSRVRFNGDDRRPPDRDHPVRDAPITWPIGSDTDHVRVPLGLPAALRVADAFEMMLPTTRMVDAIYAQADCAGRGSAPMPPTSAMSSTDYFLPPRRDGGCAIRPCGRAGGRAGRRSQEGPGCLSNRLSRAPWGAWRSMAGIARAATRSSPCRRCMANIYADYSHGIRLVARTAYVNGRAVDLRGLLTDGQYAGLLNSEGPLTGTTVRLAALQ